MNALQRRSAALLGFGLLAISSSSILTRLCQAPALTIAFYRVAVASLVYFALSGARRNVINRTRLKALALSGFFLAVHFAAWITSLSFTSVASSVVLVVTSPIWVTLGEMLFLKERPTARRIAAVFLTLLGSVIISGLDLTVNSQRMIGNGLALLGAIAVAGYWLVGRRMRAEMDTFSYVAWVYGACAVFTGAAVALLRLPVVGFTPKTTLFLFAIALFPQVVGHTSLNWALKHFSAATVSIVTLGEPIGASLLAWLILGERLTLVQVLGGVVILIGVALAIQGEESSRSDR